MYLIVSIPDLCCLSYFDNVICCGKIEQKVSHLKISIMAFTCNLFLIKILRWSMFVIVLG